MGSLGFNQKKETQESQRTFDPYTERARALGFMLLLNPGLLQAVARGRAQLGRAIGMPNDPSRFNPLLSVSPFTPRGINASGVPMGVPGSSSLEGGGDSGTTTPDHPNAFLPWTMF